MWPLLRVWEALVAGLPSSTGGPGGLLTHTLSLASLAAEGLPHAAEGPPHAAGSSQAPSPETRLAAAHAAVLDFVWHQSQRVQVTDAGGVRWDPATHSLRAWRASQPAPHWLRREPEAYADDPWGHAARQLARAGIWAPQAPTGRWLRTAVGWALLWTLSGRDLQRAHLEASGRDLGLGEVLAGLHWWGYLRDGAGAAEFVTVVRASGNTVRALAVDDALWWRAGFADLGLRDRTP